MGGPPHNGSRDAVGCEVADGSVVGVNDLVSWGVGDSRGFVASEVGECVKLATDRYGSVGV